AAVLLRDLGRLDEAVALMEAVARRDPVNPTLLYNLGNCQISVRRLDAAAASFRTVLSLSPGRGGAHAALGFVLLLARNPQDARPEMEREASEPHRMLGLVMADHALGRRADADKTLAAFIAKYEKDWSYNIATIEAFRGEADKAFEWLDKAVRYADPGLSDIV